MALKNPRYTFTVAGRYRYYRRQGFQQRLHGEPGSEQFEASYRSAAASYASWQAAESERHQNERARRQAWKERQRKSRLTRADTGKSGTIYFIAASAGPVKIGFTTNLNARLRRLQMNSPRKLSVLISFPGTPRDELALHRRFERDRVHGEWFKRSRELVACINQLAGLVASEQRVALLNCEGS